MTNKNEAKTIIKHISYDYRCKFDSTTCNSNQKWNNKTCQCECNDYCACKKDYSCNPSTCICENSKYLKSTSVNECDEIMSVTKKANVTSTPTINCYSIKVKDCYILHIVL